MNDPTTNDLRSPERPGQAPMVDSIQPPSRGVREVGAGVSAAVDQSGGEGVVSGLAACCETCRVEGCWCTPACREFSNFGRDL